MALSFELNLFLDRSFPLNSFMQIAPQLQSVSWSLEEFRHNKIVQSPHENYFNLCSQHKEK